jgi:hypothetical protein
MNIEHQQLSQIAFADAKSIGTGLGIRDVDQPYTLLDSDR